MSRPKQADRIAALEAVIAGFITSQTVPSADGSVVSIDKTIKAAKAAGVETDILPATPKMTWALKMAAFSVAKVLGKEDAAKVAALDFRRVPVQRGECVEVIKSSMKAKNGTANDKLSVAGELVALYNTGLRRSKQTAGK